MLAYWDASERCVFANSAYKDWFGRSREEMVRIEMKVLLGELYEKNLPYIRGALAGKRQVFERQITLPSGIVRDALATYEPDVVNGEVLGFSVVVADVTVLKKREQLVREAMSDTVKILEETKRNFRSKELGLLRARLIALLQS